MAAKKTAKSKSSKRSTKHSMKSNSLRGSEKRVPPKKAPSAKLTFRANAEGDTPLTLDEAIAIVQTASPAKRPAARSTKASARMAPANRPKIEADAPTVASVGIARQNLEQQQQEERQQRTDEYTALMKLLKHRGVVSGAAATAGAKSRAASKGKGAVRTAARTVTSPLQVFAEGDSWFHYPVPFFGGGVIPRLQKRLGVPILNLANAGDEVRMMLGVKQREMLAKQLRNGCPAGGAWDAMLFSGGGNDIVGEPMSLWIQDFRPGVSPETFIHQSRFAAALAIVQAGYEDLIQMRNDLSPATQLYFHAYDFAIPDGRGVCHLGPWLKPTFQLRKFPTTATVATEVVKAMLQQFAGMLRTLANTHPQVTLLNTQGTLQATTSSWHNELHPSAAGFDQIAQVFYQQLANVFGDRIPN
ncbi:MAG: hypothetical protein Q8M16_18120 [Pirellulaceae bacterium]|nr:hypothetical protein [Pirellulaceae bacterium]